jgi:hypothetical protein
MPKRTSRKCRNLQRSHEGRLRESDSRWDVALNGEDIPGSATLSVVRGDMLPHGVQLYPIIGLPHN